MKKSPLLAFYFLITLFAFLAIGREVIAAQLTLFWADNSSNEDGFQIERKDGTTGTFAQIGTVAANVTTYSDASVLSGPTYCYQIRAYSTAGNFPYSNEACCSTPSSFTLSIAKNGTGQGTVTSSPAGISCGSDCSESYTSSASVTLSAAPASGSSFGGWSGGGCSGTGTCTLLVNTATSVTATFTATIQTTTLSVSPSSVVRGSNVTATWANIATPTAKDWIGLYIVRAPNKKFLARRYTTGAASGNVPFTIPANTKPGTYELRLFANDGYTKLATSSTFTVTN